MTPLNHQCPRNANGLHRVSKSMEINLMVLSQQRRLDHNDFAILPKAWTPS